VTELAQNYPNPFNPATTINFNLAKDAKVSLVVYDVMGRKVADLVNKNMVTGSHKVSFDASNLVSGVYYYTLKAGEVNQTKKMMLIK
ncbi:MAG: T9SS type A sorting domain-containing protein, partial [Candidatus Delongbacteria bacterium]|nr:T9SS type A sorting domain-containing protein [Candidatus Delongbacteria bacterium]